MVAVEITPMIHASHVLPYPNSQALRPVIGDRAYSGGGCINGSEFGEVFFEKGGCLR